VTGEHDRPPATPGAHRSAPTPTGKQLWRIRKDGGSWRDAYLGTRGEASVIITNLANVKTASAWRLPTVEDLSDDAWEVFPQELAWRRGELGSEWTDFDTDTGELKAPEPPSPVIEVSRFGTKSVAAPASYESASYEPEVEYDEGYKRTVRIYDKESRDRLKAMLPLLERITDGYYAVDLGSGVHNDLKFFRMSRPTRGEYKGCVKFQWQLADRWELAWVLHPDGRVRTHVHTFSVADYLLAILVDPSGSMRRYAKEIDKCCRCNTSLTDERSRHYGIGPECEKHRPDIITTVDLEDAMKREVEMKRWS
jgi:hypothetical protein